MIGSAIRKPRIQPGRGSASADSMIEGRTMVMGSVSPYWGHQGPLAEGLGVRVGVGPTPATGPGPCRSSTICFLTHSSRSRSARSASRCRPAAPSSPGLLVEGASSRSGRRDSASLSPRRCRRAACTSARQSMSRLEPGCRPGAPRGPRPGGCRPRRRWRPGCSAPARCVPRRRPTPGPRTIAWPPRRVRAGSPRRRRRGASRSSPTAAEWTHDVAVGESWRRPSSSSPSPSVPTSPATADTLATTSASKSSGTRARRP